MGFSSNEGVKVGYPLRRRYFAIVGSYSVKMVADRYRLAVYHNKRFLDLSTSMRFLCFFWLQRTFQPWIATKWLEIDQNNLHVKFSALNEDFSCLSPDPLESRRPAQSGVKDGYPPPLFKSGYFTALAWKQLIIIITSEHLYSALLFQEISSALNALSVHLKQKLFKKTFKRVQIKWEMDADILLIRTSTGN